MSSSSAHDSHGPGGYEKQDFAFTNLMWVIPASIVILLVYVGVCMYGFRGAATEEMIQKHAVLADTSLRAFRVHEAELLGNYGWVDKATGKVRIPIQQAMDKVVAEYGQPSANTANSSQSKP